MKKIFVLSLIAVIGLSVFTPVFAEESSESASSTPAVVSSGNDGGGVHPCLLDGIGCGPCFGLTDYQIEQGWCKGRQNQSMVPLRVQSQPVLINNSLVALQLQLINLLQQLLVLLTKQAGL